MKNTFIERLHNGTDNVSELMFSLHRYYNIAQICINKSVLDIACGTGYGSYILSNKAKSVVGFDIDKSSISYAKENFKKDNLKFIKGNAIRTGFENNSFDIVISCETIEHLTLQDANHFLTEIKRILKSKGLLFITTPNKDKTDSFDEKNLYHINEFYSNDFVIFLKKYFKYVKFYYLDLNVVTLMWEANSDKMLMSNIKVKDWEITNSEIDKPIYMAAICSDKKINKINLSSLLCDNDKVLNERLWNKLNIYEEEINQLKKNNN